jgi:hypothetical protein
LVLREEFKEFKMSAAIIDYWLNSPTPEWYAEVKKFTAVDANGANIYVNQTVKLLGTVTAINANSSHFDEVTISCKPVTVNPSQGNTVLSISVPPASLTEGS